jgi:hypothetical protein
MGASFLGHNGRCGLSNSRIWYKANSSRFIELARFGLNLIPNEESKSERFENDLNPRIKERVMCHVIRNFVKLVDIASVAERGMCESSTTYELKRRAASQVTYPSK